MGEQPNRNSDGAGSCGGVGSLRTPPLKTLCPVKAHEALCADAGW